MFIHSLTRLLMRTTLGNCDGCQYTRPPTTPVIHARAVELATARDQQQQQNENIDMQQQHQREELQENHLQPEQQQQPPQQQQQQQQEQHQQHHTDLYAAFPDIGCVSDTTTKSSSRPEAPSKGSVVTLTPFFAPRYVCACVCVCVCVCVCRERERQRVRGERGERERERERERKRK